jgi:hypothetical protein
VRLRHSHGGISTLWLQIVVVAQIARAVSAQTMARTLQK